MDHTIRKANLLSAFICATLLLGCAKFVDVPKSPLESYPEDLFTNDEGATSALMTIYGHMISDGYASGTGTGVSVLAGLSADELRTPLLDSRFRNFYINEISFHNRIIDTCVWRTAYSQIYAANAVLENLEKYEGVSERTKKILQGEAYFIRAFCHFYLVNLFGPVPYVDTTDYKINDRVVRTPTESVYLKIIADLQRAYDNLDYNDIKIRANRGAVAAMLARVHLYCRNWQQAEKYATELIASSKYKLTQLDSVFLKNSPEIIWALDLDYQNVYTYRVDAKDLITPLGVIFVLAGPQQGWNLPELNFILTDQVLQAFENKDERKDHWITDTLVGDKVFSFAYKYKTRSATAITEDFVVLRLAEQYLIRAEASVHLGNMQGALADLNAVRRRAGLPDFNNGSDDEILDAILHERQVELFTEWGHRWFDLKRTGNIDAVMSKVAVQKGQPWESYKSLYPIPYLDIVLNPNMTQNPGYDY